MLYNISLFSLWIILTGDISYHSAMLAAFIVLLVRISMYFLNIRIYNPFNWKIIIYIIWLLKEVFFSTMSVVKIIWSKSINIKPSFQEIDAIDQSEIGSILYANSITLTPGTYTVDLNNEKLIVHSLVTEKKWPLEMAQKIKGLLC